ncbi:MAG: hypothetical protein AAFR36_31715, partial [Bacteroidota bacterium]
MSNQANREESEITVNGQRYRACVADRTYSVQPPERAPTGSLIDGGCNGGLMGSDMLVIAQTSQTVDVVGLTNTSIGPIPVGTAAGLIQTTDGPIIGYFHQYALVNDGPSIHSPNQLRSFGNVVDDCPQSFGGRQCLVTHDGYKVPLSIRHGLPYMDMRKPSSSDIHKYPHVTFTADMNWDPHSVDDEVFFDAGTSDGIDDVYSQDPLDGELAPHHDCMTADVRETRRIFPRVPDFEALRPDFNWTSIDRVKQTIEHNEDVASDTRISDTPAHDDGIPGHGGCTMVQVYTGITSKLTDAFPMSSEKYVYTTVLEFLQKWGAPNNLKSDNANAVYGKQTQEILFQYCIGSKYEKRGKWCGVTANIGDVFTYWTLPDDTDQLIACSTVRTLTSEDPSVRADVPDTGESDDATTEPKFKLLSVNDIRGDKYKFSYGLEFVGARTATEQIMAIRITLRAMGVSIEEAAYLFGDNKSAITSATIPHSLWSKRHDALAYPRVRAAVAGGYLRFCHINSNQ